MAKKKADRDPLGRPTASRAQSLDETIAEINRQINEGRGEKIAVLRRADEAGSPFLLRRPFWIASLDIAIGGGMPAGGITQIDGPDGVGKDALSNRAIAVCQQIHGEDTRVAVCWLELPYDKTHARIQGVVVPASEADIFLEESRRASEGRPLLTPEEIQQVTAQVGGFAIVDSGSSEDRLQAVLSLVIKNQCQIIFVDSIAAATSHYRVETPLEKETAQGLNARLLSEWQKMLWNAYGNPDNGRLNMTTLILTNQVRTNMNRVSRRSPMTVDASPRAIRHGKLLDLQLKPGEPVRTGGVLTGKKVKWRVTKAKAGSHEGAEGEITYNFRDGFEPYTDLFKVALDYELILHPDKSQKCDVIDDHGEVLADGIEWGPRGAMVVVLLSQDQELFLRLYYACLRKAGVSCLHRL